ncbi:peptidyl-prolyl cis-trans isomerase [Actibacterium sp.]|uniref:peptidylprolyl isomerase n=1 Tax=Actibacterium sp. TaxID=1872125 RepID=UPI0035689E38
MSAGKKTGNILVWGILLLLMLGLTGFGVTNFGGSVQSVGQVGDTPISTDRYYRALTQELRAAEAQTGQRLTLAEAEGYGLVQNARARVITDTALDNELVQLGVSVGDAEVARSLKAYEAFQGPTGGFDRETYRFTLQQNGLTETEFEEQLRSDATRALLQGAIMAGRSVPEAFGDLIFEFVGARRGYELIVLDAASLDTPVGTPDEAALTAYYTDNAAAFTAPESKSITYALLTPDMLLDAVDIDESALRDLYAERRDDYIQPERRLVERLVFPTTEAAATARARLDAGSVSFDDLVAERGLSLSDIDLGDVTRADLGTAGAAVFDLSEPGVVGPIDTDFGPALIRMNAVLAAQEVTFEQAQPDLRDELAQDAARRQIADLIAQVDDQLAAGATLEELDRETAMQLGTVDYFDGQDASITGYDAFRAAADLAQVGDFPEVIELEDGGIAALRVDEVVAAHLRPLDEVRTDAIAGWQLAEIDRRLREKAEALKARADAGEALNTLGLPVETVAPVTRGTTAPATLSEPLFALAAPGDITVVAPGDQTVYLLQLTQILPPSADDKGAQFMRSTLEGQAAQGMSQDLFAYFAQSRLSDAGLTLNEAAIKAVHAQIP